MQMCGKFPSVGRHCALLCSPQIDVRKGLRDTAVAAFLPCPAPHARPSRRRWLPNFWVTVRMTLYILYTSPRRHNGSFVPSLVDSVLFRFFIFSAFFSAHAKVARTGQPCPLYCPIPPWPFRNNRVAPPVYGHVICLGINVLTVWSWKLFHIWWRHTHATTTTKWKKQSTKHCANKVTSKPKICCARTGYVRTHNILRVNIYGAEGTCKH